MRRAGWLPSGSTTTWCAATAVRLQAAPAIDGHPSVPVTAAPDRDCPLCPRLVAYRQANRGANPDWFNAPVPSFGPKDARMLIVGLAPGVRGANRTGRPFTGDFAGTLLYQTLLHVGLARGEYRADPHDGLTLVDCRIANAVRCVPPANLPKPVEIGACNPFLAAEMAEMARLSCVLALGGVAHRAVLRARGLRASHVAFQHGVIHALPGGLLLADSYHVSRLNTNTGRLTEAMFRTVVQNLMARLPAR
jgi:uracil-DNA glycosylase family 4